MVIDNTYLDSLPEDGSISHRLRNIESEEMQDPGLEEGPPDPLDAEVQENQEVPLYTRAFAPNVQTTQTEIEQLHAAAFHTGDGDNIILTMPELQGTPVSEFDGTCDEV